MSKKKVRISIALEDSQEYKETKEVSRKVALELITVTHKSKICNYLFKTKESFVREIKGVYHGYKEPYITILSFRDEGYRNINIETLKFVIIDKIKYKIKR